MTEKQIQSRLGKFLKETLSKYPNIYGKKDLDKGEYYKGIHNELLKYFPAENISIENYCITSKSGRLDFIIDHPKRDPQTKIYIRFINIQGINTVQTNIDIGIDYHNTFICSNCLNIEMFPEVVKAFIELDNSFDKVLEEIGIEKSKDKKMSDMIGVTVKTLIEKKFGDRISRVDTYLDENILKVEIRKSSRNKAIFKINIKKFENNFDVILEGVEHFLEFQTYDWLKFEYKGL